MGCRRCLALKGKFHFSAFSFVPDNWEGNVDQWIEVMAKSNIELEGLRLKRMVISDECLELISTAFVNFKSTVLVSCEGFSTNGFAVIVANCRHLTELYLQENYAEHRRGHSLSCFPETCTSLASLNFACLQDVNLVSLEKLVARSPNPKSMKLNRAMPLETLRKLLTGASKLKDLATGSFVHDGDSETYNKLKCAHILEVCWGSLKLLPAAFRLFIIFAKNSLNLSDARGIHENDLIKLIS